MNNNLPKEVVDYIQDRVNTMPDGCGNVTVKVTRSGYVDVEVSESKRFPISKQRRLAGEIVGGKKIVVKKGVKRA